MTITIRRSDLLHHNACSGGLDVYDAEAKGADMPPVAALPTTEEVR